jgi:hypothetical protein
MRFVAESAGRHSASLDRSRATERTEPEQRCEQKRKKKEKKKNKPISGIVQNSSQHKIPKIADSGAIFTAKHAIFDKKIAFLTRKSCFWGRFYMKMGDFGQFWWLFDTRGPFFT